MVNSPTTHESGPSGVALPSDPRRDALRAEINRLHDDDRKAADYIDRAVLVGGTAAIVWSLTFLGDIAPNPAPGSRILLIVSWASFLLGAAFALLSLLSTRATARAIRRMLQAKVDSGLLVVTAADYEPARRPNFITKALSRSGLTLFFIGGLLLLAFGVKNLPPEQSQQGGQPPYGAGDSTLLSLFRQADSACAGRACLLIMRYDYDLPKPGTGTPGPSSPQQPDQGRPPGQ